MINQGTHCLEQSLLINYHLSIATRVGSRPREEIVMSDAEILECLKRVAGISDAYLRREFTVFRETQDGDLQEVTVVVLDAGPSRKGARFHVFATTEDGGRASGNPAESLDSALAIVHWSDLDHKPSRQNP